MQIRINGRYECACDCAGRGNLPCRHLELLEAERDNFERLLEHYVEGELYLPPLPSLPADHPVGTTEVVEIFRNDDGMKSVLSVPRGQGYNHADGKRTIVRWNDHGRWDCFHCGRRRWSSYSDCVHRARAARYLLEILGPEEFNEQNDDPDEADQDGASGWAV